MAMALVLATLALAFATVMGMVAAAVLAYFCWSGAIWLLEPNDCSTTVGETSDARNRGVSSWTDSSVHHLVQRADAMGRLPMSHELAWSAHIRHAGAFPSRYQCNDLTGDLLKKQAAQCVSEEEVQSPLRSKKETRHLDLSPEAVKMPNRSRVAREAVSVQDLQRGYAAHFALWLNGDFDFHFSNVRAVADAYQLNAPDICYCFLCLEEAAKGNLALKKWGIGMYAARIWMVSLARFVKIAQRMRGAQDEDTMVLLCQEWRYKQDHFVREVLACEVPFQREHGKTLLAAFQTEDIRKVEVCRAQQLLLQHATTPAKGSRGQHQLALPSSSSSGQQAKALMNEAEIPQKRRTAEPGTVALPTKRSRKTW